MLAVHNATVCVDFIEKGTFMGILFVENVPKNCFLFAFFKLFIFLTHCFLHFQKFWWGSSPPCPSRFMHHVLELRKNKHSCEKSIPNIIAMLYWSILCVTSCLVEFDWIWKWLSVQFDMQAS